MPFKFHPILLVMMRRTVLLILGCEALRDADLDVARFSRVAVIPDVHGDLQAGELSLFLAYSHVHPDEKLTLSAFIDLFDADVEKPLVDGVAIVQLGDIIDKGPHSSECLAFFSRAERVLGVPVFLLYGNHELMAMMNYDYDDQIHPKERWDRARAFDPKIGNAWKYIHTTYLAMLRIGRPKMSSETVGRLEDLSIHDVDVDKELQTLDAEATLANQPQVITSRDNHPRSSSLVDSEVSPKGVADLFREYVPDRGTLFVHAGIDLGWFSKTEFGSDVNGINQKVAQCIQTDDTCILDPTSFLFTRGFAQDKDICERMDSILEFFNVDRIIVGHSIQFNENMVSRCNGRIILADIASSQFILGPGPAPIILGMTFEKGGLVGLAQISPDKSKGIADRIEPEPQAERADIIVVPVEKAVIYEDHLTILELPFTGGILQTIHVPGVSELIHHHVCHETAVHTGVPNCARLEDVKGSGVFMYNTESIEKIVFPTESIIAQIMDIVTHFHSNYMTIVFTAKAKVEWKWLQKFFAVSKSGRVHIINFSRLSFETNPINIRREFNFVNSILFGSAVILPPIAVSELTAVIEEPAPSEVVVVASPPKRRAERRKSFFVPS